MSPLPAHSPRPKGGRRPVRGILLAVGLTAATDPDDGLLGLRVDAIGPTSRL